MKRLLISLIFIVLLNMGCSAGRKASLPPGNGPPAPALSTLSLVTATPAPVGQLPASNAACGDNICDGPENAQSCPQDCTAAVTSPEETPPTVEVGSPITYEPGDEPDTYWVTNPTSGARLFVRVLHPSDWAGEPRPALILVPGGNGFSADFLRPPRNAATRIADVGFTVVIFDPDGRGHSEGGEDQNGFIQQDGLAAVIQFAATLPEIDAAQIGVISFSFGITMASGALVRYPGLPVQFLIDWEGPANRNDTGGCDAAHTGHLAGEVACDDEAFWAEREASTFALTLQVPYLRLQSEKDHVQPDYEHTLLMITNATASAYGGSGIAPWTRLNDLPPNTVYTVDTLPAMMPEDQDQQLDTLVAQYAQELLEFP